MTTKADTIEQIERLVQQLAARFGEEDEAEQQWLVDQCSPDAARVIATMSVQALHLVDAIPAYDDADASVNIVGLSRATGVPKGTVSKTAQRLASDGVVARHRLPDNRKEVHLRLTKTGTEIQRTHRSLHEQMGSGLSTFFSRYTAADLRVITRVLDDLLRMPREGLRFRPDLLD
ncbi:MAG: MarR family winged helix-turn-helix transcriptional regulator [Nocardioidaceae bacterium]